jgi:hypothetical protein
MGQSKFRLCNSIFLRNPSLRKQKCQKLKKKSVGIYFSLFIGINLRIRRFNYNRKSMFSYFREPNTNEQVYRQFSKTHNYLIEHSDSDKVTSKKKTQPHFL